MRLDHLLSRDMPVFTHRRSRTLTLSDVGSSDRFPLTGPSRLEDVDLVVAGFMVPAAYTLLSFERPRLERGFSVRDTAPCAP